MDLKLKTQDKGILYGTRAYLAGNLECSADSYGWRERMRQEFSSMGIITLDPTKIVFNGQPLETEEKRKELMVWRNNEEYDRVREYMVPVVQKDCRQIDVSDFIVFNFQIDKPTFGTNHELVLATQQKKPIFLCVGDKKKTPLWFFGILKHKYIYNTLDEIIDVLKKINSGEKEISSERWRILIKEFRYASE